MRRGLGRHRLRLLALVSAGGAMLLGWLALLPISYVLSRTPEFTQAYVSQYSFVWQPLSRPLNFIVAPLEANAERTVFLAAALIACGYIGGLTLLGRGGAEVPGATRLIVAFTLCFQVCAFLLPGLFSSDLFGYVAYGRIAAVYGQNPFLVAPSHFPDDPLVGWTNPVNRGLSSPYGPVWTDMAVLSAMVTRAWSAVDQVLGHKLLMNVVQLVNLTLVWGLLGRLWPGAQPHRQRASSLAAFAWNPLLIFELCGNGHNDGLVVMLVLVGLVPLALSLTPASPATRQPRAALAWAAGSVCIGLATLVKYTAGVVGVLYLSAWARRATGWPARLSWVGGVCGLLGLGSAMFWPWLQSPDVFGPVLREFGIGPALPADESSRRMQLILLLDDRLSGLGLAADGAAAAARGIGIVLPRILLLLYLMVEIRKMWLDAPQQNIEALRSVIFSAARASLVMLFLVSVSHVWAWYLALPLALAVLVGWQHLFTKVVVAYSLVWLSGYLLRYVPPAWNGTAGVAIYLVPLVIPGLRLARRPWPPHRAREVLAGH